MIDVFNAIKNSVDILDAAARLGVKVDRHGKALCFVHSEKTPSMSFRGGRYKCFGCGAGGDVIDMVAAIQGIPALEAAKQLDAMYSLHLFDERPDAAEVRRRAQQAQAERERLAAFEAWARWACSTIAAYLRLLEEWKQLPMSDPRFVEACHKLDYYDWLYTEVFINGDFAARADFYKTHRREVEAIAEHIREKQAA